MSQFAWVGRLGRRLLPALVVVGGLSPVSAPDVNARTDDDTARVQAWVDAGQTIPPGIFHVTNVQVSRVLRGSGRDVTSLKAILPWTAGMPAMVAMPGDGAVVEDVTLDGGNGIAIGTRHNRTTLQRAHILGGDPSGHFALYYAGAGMQAFGIGNQILDTVIDDTSTNDGFSFCYQEGAVIRNITHHGSRLALYHARNVLVENYNFTPRVVGAGGFQYAGLWVTPSSDGIVVRHWRGGHPKWGGGVVGRTTSASSMSDIGVDEMMVGDVAGLVVDGFTGRLDFNPNLIHAVLTVRYSHPHRPVYIPPGVARHVEVTWIQTPH